MNGYGDIAGLYGGDVDTSNPPPDQFEVLPPGWYPVLVEKAELKATKDRTGKYLWLQFEVIGKQYQGRKLFTNINLVNNNPEAVEIGARKLAQLGSACGLLRVGDSSEFLDKQLQVRIVIKKDDPNENDVKGFKALEGAPFASRPPVAATGAYMQQPAAIQQPPQAPAAAVQAAPATAAKMPWERK